MLVTIDTMDLTEGNTCGVILPHGGNLVRCLCINTPTRLSRDAEWNIIISSTDSSFGFQLLFLHLSVPSDQPNFFLSFFFVTWSSPQEVGLRDAHWQGIVKWQYHK